MITALAPIQERKRELLAKPGLVNEILGDGAATARKVAAQTMVQVRATRPLPLR